MGTRSGSASEKKPFDSPSIAQVNLVPPASGSKVEVRFIGTGPEVERPEKMRLGSYSVTTCSESKRRPRNWRVDWMVLPTPMGPSEVWRASITSGDHSEKWAGSVA